jgi:DNA polymerase-4
VAKTIREQIRVEMHLTAFAGVVLNRFLAKIASGWRKPDGLFLIQPSEVNGFLASLPIDRIPAWAETRIPRHLLRV